MDGNSEHSGVLSSVVGVRPVPCRACEGEGHQRGWEREDNERGSRRVVAGEAGRRGGVVTEKQEKLEVCCPE